MDLEEELEKVVNNLDKSLEDIRKLYKEITFDCCDVNYYWYEDYDFINE